MIIKVKKINFSAETLEIAKDDLNALFESFLGDKGKGFADELLSSMDVWLDTSKVIAATEVQKLGNLPAAFKIFFDAEHSWDIEAESYDDFISAWTLYNNPLQKKPLLS